MGIDVFLLLRTVFPNEFSTMIPAPGLPPVDRSASLLILVFRSRSTGFILAGEKVFAIVEELIAVRLTQRGEGW